MVDNKNMEYNINKYYEKSIKALKRYIKANDKTINEKNWNKRAIKYKYLSSESMGYIYGLGFNKLCRNLIKQVHQRKRR